MFQVPKGANTCIFLTYTKNILRLPPLICRLITPIPLQWIPHFFFYKSFCHHPLCSNSGRRLGAAVWFTAAISTINHSHLLVSKFWKPSYKGQLRRSFLKNKFLALKTLSEICTYFLNQPVLNPIQALFSQLSKLFPKLIFSQQGLGLGITFKRTQGLKPYNGMSWPLLFSKCSFDLCMWVCCITTALVSMCNAFNGGSN